MKTLEQMFDNETLNKIKIDSNKFTEVGVDLRKMIEEGLIEVAGEKKGELLYTTTQTGMDFVAKQKALQ